MAQPQGCHGHFRRASMPLWMLGLFSKGAEAVFVFGWRGMAAGVGVTQAAGACSRRPRWKAGCHPPISFSLSPLRRARSSLLLGFQPGSRGFTFLLSLTMRSSQVSSRMRARSCAVLSAPKPRSTAEARGPRSRSMMWTEQTERPHLEERDPAPAPAPPPQTARGRPRRS